MAPLHRRSFHNYFLFFFFIEQKRDKKGATNLSCDRVTKAFIKLGLSLIETKMYIYLSIEGPKKLTSIINALGIDKEKLVIATEKLEKRGIIGTEIKGSNRKKFFAYPIVKVLDILIKNNLKEAALIEENKQELIGSWNSAIEGMDKSFLAKD
jgi:sugar-specific transcriptional regulator TrmB